MMTESITDMTEADAAATLTELAERIPDPRDYFHGHCDRIGVLPRDVLGFFRAKQLHADPPSIHARHVLALCLSGAGGVIVDGDVHALRADQGVLVFPYQSHAYTRFVSGHPAWLFITFAMEDAPALEPLRGVPFSLRGDVRAALASVIQSLMVSPPEHSDAPGELLRLLHRILIQRDGGGRRKHLVAPDRHVAARMKRVVSMIASDFRMPPSIHDLASVCSLSPSRLRAFFKEHIGISIGEYMRRERIHAAARWMVEEGGNVTETAARFGYSSVFVFSRAFKSVMGVAPTLYRRAAGCHAPEPA